MNFFLNRYLVVFFVLLIACTIGLGAQGLLIGHIDITFSYSSEADEWSAEYRHDGLIENPDAQTPLHEVSLPARDFLYTNGGERFVQPPISDYDFTGIPDGDPLWLFTAADNGHSWPGFRSDQIYGTFLSYNPSDPRVNESRQWMTVELAGMDYAGTSSNPQFSLWQTQGTEVVQWMATSDGINSNDIYYMGAPSHTHANMGFSSLGIYRIALKPSAILDSTGETVVGSAELVTFAIGTKAAWTASYYAGDDLFVGAVSGDESDSDLDGVLLLLEYAFNLDPISADFKILEEGLGTNGLPFIKLIPSGNKSVLQIEYIRRKPETNPQISYFPEFSSSLAGGEWEVQTAETVTSIDEEWERVLVSDLLDTSTSSTRFGRVRVEVQEIIEY